MSARFDFVKYDEIASTKSADILEKVEELESIIYGLTPGRSQSLALTKLEECFMWCGKAIRDHQIFRDSFKNNPEEFEG